MVSDDALTLWGEICDFEQRGLFDLDYRAVVHSMTDGMRADIRRLIPQVRGLLEKLESDLTGGGE